MSIPDVHLYTSKSFRIGAASDAFALNIPVSDIQALGRWLSDAFMYYVRCGARAIRAALVQGRLAAGKGFFLAIGTVLSIGGWLIGSSFSFLVPSIIKICFNLELE